MNKKGLTLIELMAAMAVMTVIVAAAVSLIAGGLRLYEAMTNDEQLARESRAAVLGDGPKPGLVRDLQRASKVTALGGDSLSLLIERDTVTYSLDGTTLQRSSNTVIVDAAKDVAGLEFFYFKRTPAWRLAAAAAPGEVVLVEARLRFERKKRMFWAEAQAGLRNR